MQLSDLHFLTDHNPPPKYSILDWINNILPGSPPASQQSQRDTSNRCGQSNCIPVSAERRTLSNRKPLGPTSGNAMPRPESPTKRRVSPRKQPSTPRKTINNRTQTLDEDHEQMTPRAHGTSYPKTFPPVPNMNVAVRLPPPTYDNNPVPAYNGPPSIYDGPDASSVDRSSPSRSSQSDDRSEERLSLRSGGRARASSPVKEMADLDMAEKPVAMEALDAITARQAGGVLKHFRILLETSRGEGVIPPSLKALVERSLDEEEWPPLHCYGTQAKTAYDDTIGETVLRIHKNARKCEKEASIEGKWNSHVHGLLLELVIDNPKYAGALACENITAAKISPKTLSMIHLSGSKMEDKMVDFALVIKPSDQQVKRIKHTLQNSPKEAQSVNQTSLAALRKCPIFSNAETKIPFTGGQTSDVQLCIWSNAGITRLRQMLADNGKGEQRIPTIPLLSAHGHDLHLSAFQEGSEMNLLLGKLDLGSTATVLGIFQLVKALDILANWGNTEYRTWFFENAIKA